MTWRPFHAVVEREMLKLARQRGRLVAQFLAADKKSWPEYLEVLLSSNEFDYID